jgi:hypothetical protein
LLILRQAELDSSKLQDLMLEKPYLKLSYGKVEIWFGKELQLPQIQKMV